MKNYIKVLNISGHLIQSKIFVDKNGGEWIRFMVDGCWAPQAINTSDAPAHVHVHTNSDGSINASTQRLVPVEKAPFWDWMNEQMDQMLNGIEESLGLAPDSLTSSSHWAGYDSKQLDYLMSESERAIVAE